MACILLLQPQACWLKHTGMNICRRFIKNTKCTLGKIIKGMAPGNTEVQLKNMGCVNTTEAASIFWQPKYLLEIIANFRTKLKSRIKIRTSIVKRFLCFPLSGTLPDYLPFIRSAIYNGRWVHSSWPPINNKINFVSKIFKNNFRVSIFFYHFTR